MIKTRALDVDDCIDRLLVVSDIHGFAEPLEAFDRIRAGFDGQSQVIFNGDLYLGGIHPVQTTQWVQEHAGAFAVIGNHDEGMLRGGEGDQPPYTEAGAYVRLSESAIRYIRELPHQLNIRWRSFAIRLMHGHVTPSGAVGSWTAKPSELLESFADPAVDLTIVSHTHFAFQLKKRGVWIANPGAMSRPILAVRDRDGTVVPQSDEPIFTPLGDPRCSFITITSQDDELDVRIIRFDYDREQPLQALIAAGSDNIEQQRAWMTDGIYRR